MSGRVVTIGSDGGLIERPLSFPTVAAAEAATFNSGEFCAVFETGLVYQYDPASSAVRDGYYILNTGGTGRLITILKTEIESIYAAQADAATALSVAYSAGEIATAAQPIALIVGTGSINDSEVDIIANGFVAEIIGAVESQYTLGATATASLYHPTEASITFPSETVWPIGGKAVGEKWKIQVYARNTDYVRRLRITIGGSPSAGSSIWFLTRFYSTIGD